MSRPRTTATLDFELDCDKCFNITYISLPNHRTNRNGVSRWRGVKCPHCDQTYTIELERYNSMVNYISPDSITVRGGGGYV